MVATRALWLLVLAAPTGVTGGSCADRQGGLAISPGCDVAALGMVCCTLAPSHLQQSYGLFACGRASPTLNIAHSHHLPVRAPVPVTSLSFVRRGQPKLLPAVHTRDVLGHCFAVISQPIPLHFMRACPCLLCFSPSLRAPAIPARSSRYWLDTHQTTFAHFLSAPVHSNKGIMATWCRRASPWCAPRVRWVATAA